jgi:PmbA protein
VASFIAEAVALTRALEPDEYRAMPDPARFAHRLPDLDIEDRAVAELDRDQRLAWCHAMNGQVFGKPKVISVSSEVGDATRTVAAASSNGFSGSYSSTSVSLYTEVTLDEGDRRPEDASWASARHVSSLPEAEGIADEALQLARARLGAVKGKTQRTTMVVDNRSAGRLIGRLLGPADGGLVQQERSFWRGRLGKETVSGTLNVVDDPRLPRGLASRPFNREGFSPAPLPLIEAGRLQNYYLDTYYARKLGMEPTTGSPSNRVVGLGERGLDPILASVGRGLLVTSWLGGNMDSTTGDFSFGVRGHLIEGGEKGAPVAEMNVTGNVIQLFSRLVEVGNDPWESSPLLAPTLVFEDVQFSGA